MLSSVLHRCCMMSSVLHGVAHPLLLYPCTASELLLNTSNAALDVQLSVTSPQGISYAHIEAGCGDVMCRH